MSFPERLFPSGHFSLKNYYLLYYLSVYKSTAQNACIYRVFDLSQRHITIEKVLHYAKKFPDHVVRLHRNI